MPGSGAPSSQDLSSALLAWCADPDQALRNARPSADFRKALQAGLLRKSHHPGAGSLYRLTDAGRIVLQQLLDAEELELAAAAAQSKLQEADA